MLWSQALHLNATNTLGIITMQQYAARNCSSQLLLPLSTCNGKLHRTELQIAEELDQVMCDQW